MSPETYNLSFEVNGIDAAIFAGEDPMRPAMEAGKNRGTDKKKKAQIWRQKHTGQSHAVSKPNLERLGRKIIPKFKDPKIH